MRPALAWEATGLAATVAHQTGLPEACAKVRAALDALDAPGARRPSAADWPDSSAEEIRIWIRASTDPFGKRAETVPCLHRAASGPLSDPAKVGGAAWDLDETELAVRVLREAVSRLRAPRQASGRSSGQGAVQKRTGPRRNKADGGRCLRSQSATLPEHLPSMPGGAQCGGSRQLPAGFSESGCRVLRPCDGAGWHPGG